MPIYEYRCTTCGHLFEVFARMSDPDPERCESCSAETVEKVLHPVSVHYRGSGFYSTDYGSRRRPSGGDGGSAESQDAGSGKASSSDSAGDGGSSGSSSAASSGDQAPHT